MPKVTFVEMEGGCRVVEVPAGTTSALGVKLDKAKTWTFATPTVTLVSHWPSYGPQRRDVIMFASFDQRIDPADRHPDLIEPDRRAAALEGFVQGRAVSGKPRAESRASVVRPENCVRSRTSRLRLCARSTAE